MDAEEYCEYQRGYHSHYDFTEKRCNCDLNYTDYNNLCVTIADYCKYSLGGIYNEQSKQCNCPPKHELIDTQDSNGKWIKKCRSIDNGSVITFICLVILLMVLL
jgi:hypothetical protein